MSNVKLRRAEKAVNEWLVANGLEPVILNHTPFVCNSAGTFHYHRGGGDYASIGITHIKPRTIWHEVGHYIDHATPGLRKLFGKECEDEDCVTLYACTNMSEAFAEAFAVFRCGHSGLMQRDFPLQFQFFQSRYGS